MTQSWENCRYAVAAGGGDEMSQDLRQNGFNETYACSQPQLVALKIYPTTSVGTPPIPMAKLFWILTPGPIEEKPNGYKEKLQEIVERSLAGCKHCKFYEEK